MCSEMYKEWDHMYTNYVNSVMHMVPEIIPIGESKNF